jgi:hypothetical protein
MTACATIIIARLALILAQDAYESCYHRRVRQTLAQCTQIELVGDRVRAHFDSDLIPAPGQFLLARLIPAFDPYLRRPLFPTQIADSGFAVVLSPTDSALKTLVPGAKIDLMGPVGAATPDFPSRTRVLLIADFDPSVLLPFAARAIAQRGAATLLLSTHYPPPNSRPLPISYSFTPTALFIVPSINVSLKRALSSHLITLTHQSSAPCRAARVRAARAR